MTALIFDTFNLSEYATKAAEKELLKDFEFRRTALIAVPKGSETKNIKASDFPDAMVEALGGLTSSLFSSDLKQGVTFISDVALKSGSDSKLIMTALGAGKTSHIIRGRLSDEFLDILKLLQGVSFPNLLAYLNLNISIPNLVPNFIVPFGFENSRFSIKREKDIGEKATGVLTASLYSDISIKTPKSSKSSGTLKTTFPAVNISYSVDTGIRFAGLPSIDWPKLFDLPWASLTNIKFDASFVENKTFKSPNLRTSPILKIGMASP